MKTVFYIFIALVLFNGALIYSQNITANAERPWKGNAILGNGNLCLVYSDDARMVAITKSKGIQHFYFKDYATDYIAASAFELYDENGKQIDKEVKEKPGIESFFTAITKSTLANGLTKEVRCYVHPNDAVVLTLKTGKAKETLSYKFSLTFRKNITSDKVIKLTSLLKDGNKACAVWENNTSIIVTTKTPGAKVEVTDSVVTITGSTNTKGKNEIIITVGDNSDKLKAKIKSLFAEKDLYLATSAHWNNWMNKGVLPVFKPATPENAKYVDYYKRCLYSVKSACLNGNIPADMTGQFMTNGMPQLYPRDAMKSARVFMLTGHFEEAKSIIKFWTNPAIPKKSIGEYYARYDANAKAVDGGSGARYDEPEWDANGYFIQLVNDYNKQKKEMLADNKFIFELGDFLVNHIDKSGLLYEGGIVEWTGYLPATNMACAAGLNTASQFAAEAGDKTREANYKEANAKISSSLIKTFSKSRNAYCAVRFHGVKAEGNISITDATKDTLFLWDVSANFGILWGYPNHKEMELTNKFYEENTQAIGGGMQYFEASDNAWLSGYGGDVFFFTTAAAAQYQALYGCMELAKKHIDWMIKNSNSYGLMPERIYLNESNCSDASPLTWCNAEFAAAVLEWSKKLQTK